MKLCFKEDTAKLNKSAFWEQLELVRHFTVAYLDSG